MAKKTKTLAFDPKVLEAAEKLAKKDHRSFNNWLECLLIREVEKFSEK